MGFWVYLIGIEFLPILLWVTGAICDGKVTKYPNMKIGYRSNLSMKNKLTWEYSNKVFAHIAGSSGTFLFVMNAIILMSIGVDSIKFIIGINILVIILVIFITEKTLKKKFDLNGEIKSN